MRRPITFLAIWAVFASAQEVTTEADYGEEYTTEGTTRDPDAPTTSGAETPGTAGTTVKVTVLYEEDQGMVAEINTPEHFEHNFRSTCNKELDILMFFDGYDPHLDAKANIYHMVKSSFTDQVESDQVRFSYLNRNNDERNTRMETFVSFIQTSDEVMDKTIRDASSDATARTAIPLYDNIQTGIGSWFSAGNRVRASSTKMVLAFIHTKNETRNMIDENMDETFNQLFVQQMKDLGIYVHFVLMPDHEGQLDNMARMLKTQIEFDKYTDEKLKPVKFTQLPGPYSDWLLNKDNRLAGIAQQMCKDPYPSLWTNKKRRSAFTTKFDFNCEKNGKYGDNIAKNLYNKAYSTRQECNQKHRVEFDLTIIADSTAMLKADGHSHETGFIRRLLMHLPPCSNYNIMRMSHNDQKYSFYHPNGEFQILTEAIQSNHLYHFYEASMDRYVSPTFDGLKHVIENYTPVGRKHVTLFILGGLMTDLDDLIENEQFQKYTKFTNFGIVSTNPLDLELLNQLNIGDNGFIENHDSPKDLFNNAEDIARKIYCMKKRNRQPGEGPPPPSRGEEEEVQECGVKQQFHIAFDHRSSSRVIDQFMSLGWKIVAALSIDNTDFFMNGKPLVKSNKRGETDGEILKASFRTALLDIGNWPFKVLERKPLDGPGLVEAVFSDYYNDGNPTFEWSDSMKFSQLIVLSKDATWTGKIENSRFRNKDMILNSMKYGAFITENGDSSSDTRIYLSSDQSSTNKAYKSLMHKKQKFFDASDETLLIKRADYKNKELEQKSVGSNGLFCPKEQIDAPEKKCPYGEDCTNTPPKNCCQETENQFCFDEQDLCGAKVVADIAVVLDGSIPAEYSGLINKFLNDVVDNSMTSEQAGFKESDYGREGSRIAVYTAAGLVLQPRKDKAFKPWVQGQNQFDNMLREHLDCTEWEHRACNKVFYETDGSFNFAQSDSVTDYKSNVDNLCATWGKRTSIITQPSKNVGTEQSGSFESVDMDASVAEVIKTGFECGRGARVWPAVERRLFILTWDYTTLQSKTLELAKLQDLNPQVFFLNAKDTKLINCRGEDFCHYNGKSYDEEYGHILNNNYTNQIQSYSRLTTHLKDSEIRTNAPLDPDFKDHTESPFDVESIKEALTEKNSVTEVCDMPLDVVVLVDGTKSVDMIGYLKQLNFVKEIVSLMNVGVGETQTRLAVMQFSEKGKAETMFNGLGDDAKSEYDTLEEVKSLDENYHRGKSTFLATALPSVGEQFRLSTRDKKTTPRVLIVLTDGNLHEDDSDLLEARNALRDNAEMRIDEIFAIGVGNSYNEKVLKEQLATDIKQEDIKKTGVINVKRPQQLRVKVGEFLKNMCTAKSVYSTKAKIGGKPDGWLEALRKGTGVPVPKPIIVRNPGLKPCERNTADTCKHDPQSIFEKRNTHGKAWDKTKTVSGCWCNAGFEDKCFNKACKCSTCDQNEPKKYVKGLMYRAKCYDEDEDEDGSGEY